jgi:hypothetical protein
MQGHIYYKLVIVTLYLISLLYPTSRKVAGSHPDEVDFF